MELSLNVIALIVYGLIGFVSPVSGEPTEKEVITYSVLGTIGVEIVIGVIAFLIWKKCKAKMKKDFPKSNNELHGHDNGAFYTNPDVSSAEQGLAPYENKREYPRAAKIHSPSHSTSPNEKSWNSLPRVQFAGPNLPRHGSYASLDNNINSQDPEIVSVNLQSQDFIGLGFNISGSMRDGIFISEVHNRGPAIESGVLKVGDRILSVTISFENMVFEDALTILSYASPYPVNICVQKHNPNKINGSYKANGYEMQLNHPLYRSQSLDALTRIMKDTLPKRSYSELKPDNKKDNSFVKQPNFIKDISSTMKDLSTSRSGTLTTSDDDNDRTREIPAFTQISEVVIHKPPTVTDISLPLKEESYFDAPTLEKNRDLKESIKLREPYKLHVYENIDYTETLESTPKSGSNIKFSMFDSDDSISKLDEQMDIHFSNCDKEFEDLKQKADEDNFKLSLDLNAEKTSDLNSPNSETEFENLEKKIELTSNYADIFDRLSENSKFPELNMSFDDFPNKYMESTEDNAWTKSNTESNDTTDFFFTPNTTTDLITDGDINAEKENNTTLDSTDFFLSVNTSINPISDSSISFEKENVTEDSFNSNPSDMSSVTVQNLLLKSNEEDGLLILPTRVEDKMREDCLEKLLPKSSVEVKQNSPDIKEQILGEIEFDKFDSPKDSAENLKGDNESELLSLKNGDVNFQGSAFKYEVPLPASDLTIQNTLYSVENNFQENTPYGIESKVQESTSYSIEKKAEENPIYSIENQVQEKNLFSVENDVQETIPDILKESSSFAPAFVKSPTKLDSVDSLFTMTKDDDISIWKTELSPNEITSPQLTPEVTTKDFSSTFFRYESKEQDVGLLNLNPETDTAQIECSILTPKVNADDIYPFSKTDGTDSSSTKYELQMEEKDVSFSKPQIQGVDSLILNQDTEIIKTQMAETDVGDDLLTPDDTYPFLFKYKQKTGKIDSSLLKSETPDIDLSILNTETESAPIDLSISLQEDKIDVDDHFLPPKDTNPSFLKYELKTENTEPPLLEPETHSLDSSILNTEAETVHIDSSILLPDVNTDVIDPIKTPDSINSIFSKYEQKTEDVDFSLLKSKTHNSDPSIVNVETEKVDIDSSILLPDVNTDVVDSILTPENTNFTFSKYEQKTEDVDFSLLKSKTHISDPSIVNVETEKVDIDSSILLPDVNTDVVDSILTSDITNSTFSKYEQKTEDVDFSLLKSKTHIPDPSIVNMETEKLDIDSSILLPDVNTDVVDSILTPENTNFTFSKYEQKTEDVDFSLLKSKTHIPDPSIVNMETEKLDIDSSILLPDVNTDVVDSILTPENTNFTFSKYEQKTEDVDFSLLKSKTHIPDPSIVNMETEKLDIDSSILLPDVNTDVVDSILTPDITNSTFSKYEPETKKVDFSLPRPETTIGSIDKIPLEFDVDTNSSFLETEQKTVEIDSSFLKPGNNTDSAGTDSSDYEVKTDDIKVSLLITDEVKIDKTDLSISTPGLEEIRRERHTSSSSDNDEDVTKSVKRVTVSSQAEPLKPETLIEKTTESSHSSGSSSESEHDEHPSSIELDKQQKKITGTETTPIDSTVLIPETNMDVFSSPFSKPTIKTDVLPSESLDAAAKDNVFRVEKKIMFTEPIKLHVASTNYSTGEKSALSIPNLNEEERHEPDLPIQKTEEQTEQRTSGRSSPYKYHLKAFDIKDISLGAENSTIQTSNNSSKGNHPEKNEADRYFARPVTITPPRETSLTKSILKPNTLPPRMSLDFSEGTPNKETEVSQIESITQVKTSSEESSLESESEEHKSDETPDHNKEKSHCKLTLFKRITQKGSTSSSSDSDEDGTVSKKSLTDSFLTQPSKAESLDGNASTHSSESSFEREYTVNPLSEDNEQQPQRDTTPTPSLDHPNDSGEQEGTADEEEEEESQDKKDEAFFEMTEDELSTDTQSLSPKSAVTRAISCDGGFVTSDDSDLSKPRSNSINQEIQLPEDNYIEWSGQSPVRTESFSQLPDSALVWTGTDLTEDGKGKSDSDSDDSNNDAVTQSDVYKPRENLTQLSLSISSSSISSNETKTNGERGNDSETSFETMDLNFSRPFSESNHKTDLLRPREEDNKTVSTNYEGHGAFTVTFSAQSDTDA